MKNLTYHHTALARGYIRVGETRTESYNGRFGHGEKLFRHNPNSSRFCLVDYYIEEED